MKLEKKEMNLKIESNLFNLKSIRMDDDKLRIEILKYLMNNDKEAELNIIRSLIDYIRSYANSLIYTSNRQYMIDKKEDLIMAGIEGIYSAIEKFKHKTEIRFTSYAIYHIRKYMLNEIYENTSLYLRDIIRLSKKEKINLNSNAKDIDNFCKKHKFSINAFKSALYSNNSLNYIDDEISSLDKSSSLYVLPIEKKEDELLNDNFDEVLSEFLNEKDYNMIKLIYLNDDDYKIKNYADDNNISIQWAYILLKKVFEKIKKSGIFDEYKNDLFT